MAPDPTVDVEMVDVTHLPDAEPAETAPDAIPDIREQLEAEFARRSATRQPRTVTVQQLFGELTALVASATGKRFRNGIPTVSEQTAVKVLELSLGWALNSRNGAVNPILDSDVSEEDGGAEEDQLVPDETITAADETPAETE